MNYPIKSTALYDIDACEVIEGRDNVSDMQATYDYWDQKRAQFLANTDVVQFVKAISKQSLQIVHRANTTANASQSGFCHLNVREHVEQHGGTQVYGWQIATELTEGNDLHGAAFGIFHSNWLDANGVLWDVTNTTLNTQLFLPDPARVYDFSTLTGYNNRVVFLSDYKLKHPLEQVARNKTYFTALGFRSRDRIFEKYTQPKSREALLASLPPRYFANTDGNDQLNYEGMEWLALKYSVRFGG
jgi:hypothetical protein